MVEDAASQADVVHRGVTYDVEVDTTRTLSADCAHLIVDQILGSDRDYPMTDSVRRLVLADLDRTRPNDVAAGPPKARWRRRSWSLPRSRR